jgi:hypothetical protein
MATAPIPQPKDSLVSWLDSLRSVAGVRPVDRIPRNVITPAQRPAYRRLRPPGERLAAVPQQEVMSLVREAGVLRWRAGAVSTMINGGRAARAALPVGEVVKQYAFERLDGSQVYSTLTELDQSLTPLAAYAAGSNGLRRLRNGQLEPFPDSSKAAKKKVLLIIHGTFSNSEALITNGFQKTTAGAKLLADAEKKYDLVLVFDHVTLSASPLLNAFDLAALLRPSPASIDIICHSRGGLVARWFCEGYSDPSLKRRVLFVGSPLAGTSLAAAPRLKSTLDLLTNIAEMLRMASDLAAANPLFLAASGLLRVVGGVTGFAARTPILDAALALVPGLDGQSRVGNNPALVRLRMNTGNSDFDSGLIRYFAVKSNFEPKAIGWNFMRLFSKPLQQIGDWGADLIFESDNDLVVDTASMCEVADSKLVAIAHDFGTTDRVHHLNYFVQPETAQAVRKSFGIP